MAPDAAGAWDKRKKRFAPDPVPKTFRKPLKEAIRLLD
jgi:hypothetical protein